MLSQFNFKLDSNSKIKLYRQLYNKIIEYINNGTLPVGSKIPSVRVLASKLDISRNTVTKAYKELIDTDYLYSLEKSGFYVKLPSAVENPKTVILPQIDNNEEIPTVDSIIKENSESHGLLNKSVPISEVSDTYTQSNSIILNSGDVVNSAKTIKNEANFISPDDELLASYSNTILNKQKLLHESSEPFGDESFRVAIASFLYDFRKIDVNPAQIIVSSSFEQLLFNILSLPSLCSPKFGIQGKGLLKKAEQAISRENLTPTAAIIENCDSKIKNLLKKANFQVTEIPSDENGMNIDYLTTSGATVAYLAASDIYEEKLLSHQENSTVLSYIEWSKNQSYRYFIEYDDSTNPNNDKTLKNYDDNFNEKIIYLSSLSNLISSYINASFVILPKNLVTEYKEAFKDFGCSLSKLDQIALTDFIISGKLLKYLANVENI